MHALTRQHAITPGLKRAEGADDLVIEMAYASELPYERWWGVEVLDCAPESIRLGRLNDGAPLLYNHDWSDLRGVNEPGSVRADADRILRGRVRVTTATQAGRDAVALVEAGVLTKTSVGYEIHRVIEQSTAKSGEPVSRELDGRAFRGLLQRAHDEAPGDVAAFQRQLDAQFGDFDRAADATPVYRVIDWEPLEISLVTIPADPSVGIGRARSSLPPAAPAAPTVTLEKTMTLATPPAPADQGLDAAAAEARGAQSANERITEILAIRDLFADFQGVRELAENALRENAPVHVFQRQLNEHVAKTGKRHDASIGMSRNEAQKFSLVRAIDAMLRDDWSKAGFEREASNAVADKLQRSGVQRSGTGKGFMVPVEVQKRDLTVGTATAGGNMVATDLRPQDFIELMRARALSTELGITYLGGLVGNADITRQTGAATAYWLATEATGITESQQTIGLLQLRPKVVGAYTEVSRLLMQQSSPDVEAMVQNDLAKVLGLGIDAAVFNGSGASGQPTGILNTGSIGAFTGTSLGLAALIDAQVDVATANALVPNCRYVTTPAVAGLLSQRVRFASTDSVTLWKGNLLDGTVEGYAAHASNNIPAATMIFGDFSQVVLASWGALEIDVNPYANFTAAISGIRALYTCDVGVRLAGAFSAASTIT